MKIQFDYYLHDDYNRSELAEYLTDEGIPEEVAEAVAEDRPFYEVTLHLEVDTETNSITLLGAEL